MVDRVICLFEVDEGDVRFQFLPFELFGYPDKPKNVYLG